MVMSRWVCDVVSEWGNPIMVPANFRVSEREKPLQQSIDFAWGTLLQRRILIFRGLIERRHVG